MILAIGLGILGFVALRRAHRRCRGFHGYGYGPWAASPPYGRRPWIVHMALARIDATPAQERVIVGELDRLQERVHAATSKVKEARGDLGAAVRGSTIDDAALGLALGHVDAASADVREAAIETLRGIHAVLDDKQRAHLGDLLDRGGGWWRRGPYR